MLCYFEKAIWKRANLFSKGNRNEHKQCVNVFKNKNINWGIEQFTYLTRYIFGFYFINMDSAKVHI